MFVQCSVTNVQKSRLCRALDRNIRALGGDFGYDGKVNRAVAVSVGMLREVLAKVYHADRIVRELTN
jgi:Peptidase S46